jgi:hypothetical protein
VGGDIVGLGPFDFGSPAFDAWFGNVLGDCDCNSIGDWAITLDPRLADPFGGDLSLLGDSPLIDAGTVETAIDRNGPTAGTYFGQGPDIGALEMQ